MNKEIILQIVEESKEIPDSSLNFNTWYCEEDGVITMCPIGKHVLNHQELIKKLDVSSEAMFHKGHHKKCWHISPVRLAQYLNISDTAIDLLFNNPNLTRDQFVELVNKFITGEIEIRECQQEHCGYVYVTFPNDPACVCDNCKEDLLDMCGIK
jgi:hypothetical protein